MPPILTLTGLTNLLGISRTGMRDLIHRDPTFPNPTMKAGPRSPLWFTNDIIEWLAAQ